MTLQNTDNTVTFTGNGVTTVFPYTFPIPDEDYVEVSLYEIATGASDILDPADFSISGIGEDDGGDVTYNPGTPLAATHRITIRRVVPLTQDTDINNQGGFLPEVLEGQLDRIVMQVQQISEEVERAVKVTVGSETDPDDLIADLTQAASDAQAAAVAAATAEGNAETAQAAAEAAVVAAEAVAAGIGNLDSLSDVDTTGVTAGDGLTFNGTEWVPGAAGGGMFRGNNGTVGDRSGDIFRVNDQTLTEDVTIGATENASATGPLAVESGNTLTVASGGTLAIV